MTDARTSGLCAGCGTPSGHTEGCKWDALRAALASADTTQTLWEGHTVPASITCGEGSIVQPGCLDAPAGRRVRVVTTGDTAGQEEADA